MLWAGLAKPTCTDPWWLVISSGCCGTERGGRGQASVWGERQSSYFRWQGFSVMQVWKQNKIITEDLVATFSFFNLLGYHLCFCVQLICDLKFSQVWSVSKCSPGERDRKDESGEAVSRLSPCLSSSLSSSLLSSLLTPPKPSSSSSSSPSSSSLYRIARTCGALSFSMDWRRLKKQRRKIFNSVSIVFLMPWFILRFWAISLPTSGRKCPKYEVKAIEHTFNCISLLPYQKACKPTKIPLI